MKIIIGGDHAGFLYKKKIKEWLMKKGYTVEDVGPYKLAPGDDYPVYSFKAANKVAKDKNTVGILICGSGIGVSIAANKVKGIRAASVLDLKSAKLSKEHGDANLLTLSARQNSLGKNKRIIKAWLATPFSKEKRHVRRLAEISDYEREHMKR